MCKIIFPKINLKIEKWKWNKEYRVFVSSLGRFKDEYKRNLPIKISSKTGYCNVKTSCGYKVVHRLVLLTFRPIPNAEELTVDHLNHNKRDNSLDNLEWVTKEENWDRANADLLKDQIIKDTIETDTFICAGTAMFETLSDAVEYVLTIFAKNKNETKKETIKKNINKAIKNNKTYCGLKWNIKKIRKENK